MENAYLLRHIMRADAECSAALALLVNGVGLSGMADDDAANVMSGFEAELSATWSLLAAMPSRGCLLLVMTQRRDTYGTNRRYPPVTTYLPSLSTTNLKLVSSLGLAAVLLGYADLGKIETPPPPPLLIYD